MHEELRMQPLPETTTALAALARSTDGAGDRLAESFTAAAETARRIAPDCVGLTLSFLREGMSSTWVATDLRAAVLDGIQYLDGGPCVQAVADEALTVDVEEGPLGERRWQAFAAATAHVDPHAQSVGSSGPEPFTPHRVRRGLLNFWVRKAPLCPST